VTTGGHRASVPAALEEAVRGLESADPVVRARSATQLCGAEAGLDLVLAQIEREPEPYVVGCMAMRLGEKVDKRAAPVLCRVLETLPRGQDIARARIVRALGQLGDGAALPAVLDAALTGGPAVRPASANAITELMAGLDDAGSVLFQRSLMESSDQFKRALAPTFAKRAVEAGNARRGNEAGDPAGKVFLALRVALVLALAGAIAARWRAYKRALALKSASAPSARPRRRAPWKVLR
jgi:HEAT repeat protein